MAIAIPHRQHQPSVYVDHDAVVFDGYRETSPEVLALVRDAADPEAAAHECLAVGARALRAVQATVDSAVVEKAFGEMRDGFGRTVEELSRQVEDVAGGLLDEDEGALARALAEWKADVEKVFGDTFDPESKRSVLAKLDAVLEAAGERQVLAVRRVLNPDHEDSPLARWKADILRSVADQGQAVQQQLAALSERIAVEAAREEERERSAGKGFRYEDLLLESLTRLACPLGDVPEAVGGATGALPGSKVGDIVVSLAAADAGGRTARYVVECKDRRVPLKDALAEIERGMQNRDALAGMMVFSSVANAPIASDFQDFGDRAVVVLDKEDGDERALRLACMWARWVVRRQLAGVESEVDLEGIGQQVARAQRALDTVSAVKRAHTQAKNQIDEAAKRVDGLVAEVDAALAAVDAELRR